MPDFLNKETIQIIIFAVFVLPLLLKIGIFSLKAINEPSQENIETSVELAAQSQIPWWLGIIEWLSNKGEVGAYLLIGFVFFLKWVGEIK
ncbi:hypothetical protein [Methanolobus vulcani]|uniref:Uncharacterized protein n=1 Tax=Methanolobus vulcani TaxID=38026 RepID=A0A7Z8KQM7_9EURY|nr:hypothetical protein [Methanolobus vulcani]TQD27922.1 hypothetical protein FKV42_02350 [Methanolobus vulcani]